MQMYMHNNIYLPLSLECWFNFPSEAVWKVRLCTLTSEVTAASVTPPPPLPTLARGVCESIQLPPQLLLQQLLLQQEPIEQHSSLDPKNS